MRGQAGSGLRQDGSIRGAKHPMLPCSSPAWLLPSVNCWPPLLWSPVAPLAVVIYCPSFALVTCCTLLLWSPVAPIALVTCCRLLLWSLVEPPLLESLVASHCCGHLLPLPCGGHLLPHVASVTYCPPCFGHLLSPSRLPPLPHCGLLASSIPTCLNPYSLLNPYLPQPLPCSTPAFLNSYLSETFTFLNP